MAALRGSGQSKVHKAETNDTDTYLSVISYMDKNSMKGWAVAKVYILNDKFCHEGNGTYFTIEGAKKAHYRSLGRDMDKLIGECIDDFC